jgi:hypothetical protein
MNKIIIEHFDKDEVQWLLKRVGYPTDKFAIFDQDPSVRYVSLLHCKKEDNYGALSYWEDAGKGMRFHVNLSIPDSTFFRHLSEELDRDRVDSNQNFKECHILVCEDLIGAYFTYDREP